MLSKSSKAYEAISKARLALTEGWCIAIDPSIGSSSSLPGWAVYQCSTLLTSGVFEIDRNEDIPTRLQQLVYFLRKLYTQYPVDVLVFEDIPAQRHGGGNANAHASLLKAVGATLSVSGPRQYVGILPISWKRLVPEDYIKGDREDAEAIGRICIAEAHKIIQEDGIKQNRRYGVRKTSEAGEEEGRKQNRKFGQKKVTTKEAEAKQASAPSRPETKRA